MKKLTPRERIIIALDVETYDEAAGLVDLLSPEVDIFKVGISPFTGYGQAIVDKINGMGKKVFLDLKVHDIPNTVANAACQAACKNVFMMNFHCLGGPVMLKAACGGVQQAIDKGLTNNRPILLGVTILTSMDNEQMQAIGITGEIAEKVIDFAGMAKQAGLDGVVASAKEAREIKEKIATNFTVVTPGVRPLWAAKGDQKRVLTPDAAIEEGADYLVIGRPVIKAEDPQEAVKRIIEEIG